MTLFDAYMLVSAALAFICIAILAPRSRSSRWRDTLSALVIAFWTGWLLWPAFLWLALKHAGPLHIGENR